MKKKQHDLTTKKGKIQGVKDSYALQKVVAGWMVRDMVPLVHSKPVKKNHRGETDWIPDGGCDIVCTRGKIRIDVKVKYIFGERDSISTIPDPIVDEVKHYDALRQKPHYYVFSNVPMSWVCILAHDATRAQWWTKKVQDSTHGGKVREFYFARKGLFFEWEKFIQIINPGIRIHTRYKDGMPAIWEEQGKERQCPVSSVGDVLGEVPSPEDHEAGRFAINRILGDLNR